MNDYNSNNIKSDISNGMATYFEAKDNFNLLTSENKILVTNTENSIARLPESSPIKQYISQELDNYYAQTKEMGKINSMNNVDELRQGGPVRALVKTEEHPNSSRAAFINMAILLYGVVNIGIILAIAFMK